MRSLMTADEFSFHMQMYYRTGAIFHRHMLTTYVNNYSEIFLAGMFKKSQLFRDGDKGDLTQGIVLKFLEGVEKGDYKKLDVPQMYIRQVIRNDVFQFLRKKKRRNSKLLFSGNFYQLCEEIAVPSEIEVDLEEEHLSYLFSKWKYYRPVIYFRPVAKMQPIIRDIVSHLRQDNLLHIPEEDTYKLQKKWQIHRSKLIFLIRFYTNDIQEYLRGIYDN